jgi:hypothetical protein
VSNDRDVDFGAADGESLDEDAVEIGAEDLRSRESLDREAEVRELRRTVDELKEMYREQQKEIEELRQKVEDGTDDRDLPDIEKFAREDAYQGLSKNQRRAVEIWRDLPEYAARNGDYESYGLNYDRLRKAIADVDDRFSAKTDVDTKTVDRVRNEFDDFAYSRIEERNGSKNIIVKISVWACYRPKSIAKTLMSSKDVREFADEVSS